MTPPRVVKLRYQIPEHVGPAHERAVAERLATAAEEIGVQENLSWVIGQELLTYEFEYSYQDGSAYAVFERYPRGRRWTYALPLREWRAAGSPKKIRVSVEAVT